MVDENDKLKNMTDINKKKLFIDIYLDSLDNLQKDLSGIKVMRLIENNEKAKAL